jgi:hypothetical protein
MMLSSVGRISSVRKSRFAALATTALVLQMVAGANGVAVSQVAPTGCYQESGPSAGCTQCGQAIPAPVPCPPNDCPAIVNQSFLTEAATAASGGMGRKKSGLHTCTITYFRCEMGTCVEASTRSWSVVRHVPSDTPCP